MKKIISILLVVAMLISLSACFESKTKNNNDNDDSTANSENVLTIENAKDFFIFDLAIDIDQIAVSVGVYDAGKEPVEPVEDTMRMYGELSLEITSKKPVSFDSVEMVIELVPKTENWNTITIEELELRYDGFAEYKCEINSEEAVEVDEPEYEVIIKEISGNVIAE